MRRGNPSRSRQQSSLEFLTTYAWAILIIALFIAVVVVISLSKPAASYLPSQCSITPLFPCIDTRLYYNAITPLTFTIVFQDNLGQAMYFPANAFNVTMTGVGVSGTQSSLGSCAPAFLPSGSQAVCTTQIPGNLKPPSGTTKSTSFSITYQLCTGGAQSSCASTAYTTTGTSLQRLNVK